MSRKRAIEAAIKANKMPPIAGASRTPTYDTFGMGWRDGDADTDVEMDSNELAERFTKICNPIEEVAELTPTERGDKGFGSTGR